MTTLVTWYEKLAAKHHDWDLRLIFADWLEDQSELVLAAGQRWQVAQHRCPYPVTDFSMECHWYRVSYSAFTTRNRVHPESDLYKALYDHLTGGCRIYGSYRIYSCLQQAEADLAQALAKREQEMMPHDNSNSLV